MTYRRASWPPVRCARLAAKASALSHSGVSSTTTSNLRLCPSAKLCRFLRGRAVCAAAAAFLVSTACAFLAMRLSSKIDGVTLQVLERDNLECRLVGRRENNPRRLAGVECLAPTRGAQAPAVAGVEARESEIGLRRREIVAACLREFEKLGRHLDA